MFLTFAQVLERWLQQNRIQGFLLHMHEALQDHLKSVLDSILDRYAALALLVPPPPPLSSFFIVQACMV